MTLFPGLSSTRGGSWPSVRHYYGDVVRALFVAIAVLIGTLIPLSGDVRIAALLGAPTIIALVILAGLTSPRSGFVLVVDAIAAAVGVVGSELLAVAAYGIDMFTFASFEIVSILFLIALYYSVKNVRALSLGQIGHIDGVGEFDDPAFVDTVKE